MRRTLLMAAALALTPNAAWPSPQTPAPAASPSASPEAVPAPSVTLFPSDDSSAIPSPVPRVPSASPTATASASSPLPEPTRYSTPAPVHDLPVDGAYTLPGIWDCETLVNSKARSVYHLIDKQHLEERTTLHLPKRPPIELETDFTFDPATEHWTLSMQGGAFRASAKAWSGEVWRFEGLEYDADPHRMVRLVYTSLGPDSYRSDFEARNNGRWQTFSGATCRRYVP